MRRTISFFLLVVSLVFALQVQAQGIAVRVGTLGPGVDISFPVSKSLNLRAGGTYFSTSFSDTQGDSDVDVQFDAEVTWGGGTVMLDFHPFDNGFRLSGGVFYSLIKISGSGKPLSSFFLNEGASNEKEFLPERLGSLSFTAEYDQTVSPYLGIGFGNTAKGSLLTFLLDIGVIYSGSPTLDMTGTAMLAPTANWDTQFNDGIESFKFLPVISLGLGVRL
jgi:hypothetical protein